MLVALEIVTKQQICLNLYVYTHVQGITAMFKQTNTMLCVHVKTDRIFTG